jgi:hypothetical protein
MSQEQSNHAMTSGQARSIQRKGDFIRRKFKEQCCQPDETIAPEHLRGLTYPIQVGSYTMKSGKNWQFHLGRLGDYMDQWKHEISPCGRLVRYGVPEELIYEDLYSEQFVRSFILKENYLVSMDSDQWIIFSCDDILELLLNPEIMQWRILESGRIKGDILGNWGKRSIFTIEYRAEPHKKSFVLGAHGGGSGARLGAYLMDALLFNPIPIDFELWNE